MKKEEFEIKRGNHYELWKALDGFPFIKLENGVFLTPINKKVKFFVTNDGKLYMGGTLPELFLDGREPINDAGGRVTCRAGWEYNTFLFRGLGWVGGYSAYKKADNYNYGACGMKILYGPNTGKEINISEIKSQGGF